MRRPDRRGIAIVFACASLAVIAPAAGRADTPGESRDLTPLEKARLDFERALELEKADRWAEALERLESVAEVRRTPQVEYHIALCLKNVGKPVEATRGFRRAVELAKAEPPGAAAEVLQNAPEQLEALRGLVGRLYLEVEGHGRFRIFVDGAVVPLSELDQPVPVNPGKHEIAIEVTDASGMIRRRKERTEVAAGEERRVVLTIAEVPRAEPGAASDEDREDPPAPSPVAPAEPEGPIRWPSYVAFGVAGAGAILTGVFIGLRQDAIDTVTASCRDPIARTGCDPDTREDADRGLAYQGAAIGTAIGTAAAIATGIGLWIAFTPSSSEPSRSTLVVLPGYAGFHGAF